MKKKLYDVVSILNKEMIFVYIQNGQFEDVKKQFPEVKREDCTVVAEFGNDKEDYFSGKFTVNIKKRGIYRFEDGKMIFTLGK